MSKVGSVVWQFFTDQKILTVLQSATLVEKSSNGHLATPATWLVILSGVIRLNISSSCDASKSKKMRRLTRVKVLTTSSRRCLIWRNALRHTTRATRKCTVSTRSLFACSASKGCRFAFSKAQLSSPSSPSSIRGTSY